MYIFAQLPALCISVLFHSGTLYNMLMHVSNT